MTSKTEKVEKAKETEVERAAREAEEAREKEPVRDAIMRLVGGLRSGALVGAAKKEAYAELEELATGLGDAVKKVKVKEEKTAAEVKAEEKAEREKEREAEKGHRY